MCLVLRIHYVFYRPSRPAVDRSRFTPGLTRLPDGRLTLDTAFTRLTGRSAVMLAGMTPTTVDPEIVAAAANAGYWSELAGGGQTTAKVLADNLEGLRRRLEPGRTAAFNAMFMDRYLWNLHLGTQRLLSKARSAGAPVDGVVISAGIPELDEAVYISISNFMSYFFSIIVSTITLDLQQQEAITY